MSQLWMVFFLTLIWCGFSNNFTIINIIFGFIIAWLCHKVVSKHLELNKFHINPFHLFILIIFVIIELFKSSLIVALEIIRINPGSNPKIIKIPLDCTSDLEKTFLANLISLTPGTLTIDLTDHDHSIIIHSMFAKEPQTIVDYVKLKLEPKILKVFNHERN